MKFEDIKEKIYAISGLLILGQEEWLFETAKALPDGAIIVEIGGYLGRSTCCLAFGCIGSQKRVCTIDTFADFVWLGGRNPSFFETWRTNIRKNNLLEYVIPLVGFSRDVAKIWEKPIDLLFIDGSHQYEDVLADFNNFYPYVVSGGVVALHDVEKGHPDAMKVWHTCVKEKLIEIGDCRGLAYGKKPKEANK